jgi:hypothetical protein
VWHFDALLAGTRRGYFSLSLRSGSSTRAEEVCPLSGDASASPPRLAALPPSGEALLLADAVGIVVSMAGAPRGNPLPFGAPPAALAHTPPYVLALTPDRRALDVWERASGARVQSLALPPPPPGGASGGGLLSGVTSGNHGGDAAASAAAAADDGAGRAVALARGRSLLLLLPAPLEEQARELLRARHADAALSLADAAVAAATPPGGAPPPPPPWLDTLRAEIGFLRLHEGAWAAAAEAWRSCGAFEPAELFPLFPSHAAPFLAAAPVKKYWCALFAPCACHRCRSTCCLCRCRC